MRRLLLILLFVIGLPFYSHAQLTKPAFTHLPGNPTICSPDTGIIVDSGPTTFLGKSDGTCFSIAGGGGGTVTSVSSGNLSPLFTATFATPTSTPALSFTLSNSAANTIFGNCTDSTGAPAHCAITYNMLPYTFSGVWDCNKASGSTSAAKVQNCVNDVTTAGGGVADMRHLPVVISTASTIDLCASVPVGGSANLDIWWGNLAWLYSGSGKGFTCASVDGATASDVKKGRKIQMMGAGRQTTLFAPSSGNTTCTDLFYFQYGSYIELYNGSLVGIGGSGTGQCTHLLTSDQSINITLFAWDVYGNTATNVAGQYPIYVIGGGFMHFNTLIASGGIHPIHFQVSSSAVPASIATALDYSTNASFTDGLDTHDIHLNGTVVCCGWKSNVYFDSSNASQNTQDVTLTEVMSSFGGLAATSADDESCLYAVGATGQVRGLNIFGGSFQKCNQHGIVFEGNVSKSMIAGCRLNHNGNVAGTPNQVYFKNGSGGTGPSSNKIDCTYEANGTAGGNAFLSESNSTKNKFLGNTVTYAFTAATADEYEVTTSTGFLKKWLGGVDATGSVYAGLVPLVFDGATQDSFRTGLVIVDPTANRTITAPNANSVTVQPKDCVGSGFAQTISTLGVVTCASDTAQIDIVTGAIATLASATTYWLGGGTAITNTVQGAGVQASHALTITAAYCSTTSVGGVQGVVSSGTIAFGISINGAAATSISTSNTLVTPASNATTSVNATGLSIAVTTGQVIEVKMVTPTFSTPPTLMHLQCSLAVNFTG